MDLVSVLLAGPDPENIFMFIPFGILAPVLFKRMKKMYWCVLAGFLMSCTIEISQLLTQRGYMQIDDVLTNTAGAMAGWLIWMNITVRQSRQSGVARATCPD